MDWDFGSSEDATDTIPFGFKSIVTPVPGDWGKMSKAQRQALENQNLGIHQNGPLTSIDVLLSKYGQAVTLDPDFEVKHSEDDKNLVANAQYRYLEEKGLFLTNYLSTGMIAGALSVWYVGSPTIRIRKNAKKKLFKGRGTFGSTSLLSDVCLSENKKSTRSGKMLKERLRLNEDDQRTHLLGGFNFSPSRMGM